MKKPMKYKIKIPHVKTYPYYTLANKNIHKGRS